MHRDNALLHSTKCKVFSGKRNINVGTSKVLAWFDPFVFPKLWVSLRITAVYTQQCDYSTKRAFRKWFPATFPGLANTQELSWLPLPLNVSCKYIFLVYSISPIISLPLVNILDTEKQKQVRVQNISIRKQKQELMQCLRRRVWHHYTFKAQKTERRENWEG
jgi:hypothetical protein